VNLLLDTHIILWAAGQPEKLSESARSLLMESEMFCFSVQPVSGKL
jgi:PIN domain nuclease of toxin-antitoxin system